MRQENRESNNLFGRQELPFYFLYIFPFLILAFLFLYFAPPLEWQGTTINHWQTAQNFNWLILSPQSLIGLLWKSLALLSVGTFIFRSIFFYNGAKGDKKELLVLGFVFAGLFLIYHADFYGCGIISCQSF